MNMGDLHPALVHLPIGILSLYTLAEMLRWGNFFHSKHWQTSKAFMLIVGVLGSFLAFSSGEALEDLYGASPLLDAHGAFGAATVAIYGMLAIGYLIWVIDNSRLAAYLSHGLLGRLWHILTLCSGFLRTPVVSVSAALLGFVLLSITGALGGAIVRGREADFLVTIVYDLFVK